MELRMTIPELSLFLRDVFPQLGGRFEIEALSAGMARVRMETVCGDLRPGGTVSGPAMFTLADCAFYIAVLAVIGREALTVTTNATINFLNKPEPAALICEARILKLGKLLATGDATLFSEGGSRPVAHATLTYAIPPRK